MDTAHFKKAAILMLFIVLVAVTSWEFYLRHIGKTADYNNDDALFARSRAMIYESPDKTTVFAGSSRIKFDIDLPTWRSVTGEHAVQLGYEGSSPMPVLQDLANDENFKGKLVVDVTEFSLFAPNERRLKRPLDGIKYFKEATPSQHVSARIGYGLESQLVFLDKDNYSMTALLDRLGFKNRDGVTGKSIFPQDFRTVSFDRQTIMTEHFLADTAMQRRVQMLWANPFQPPKVKPMSGAKLDTTLHTMKKWVDRIKSRGGLVIFVRPPSSPPMLPYERKYYPRTLYFDQVIQVTGCPGIYFEDYPAIAHFKCPEWSHLSPNDAAIYTKNLALIMQQEKGWKFPKTVLP